ncbi:MAG: recombination protein NinG [Methylococcales bacterium]
MAVAKRKCKLCKEYKSAEKGNKYPIGWFCCQEHALKFASEQTSKRIKLENNKAKQVQAGKVKAQKTKDKWRLKELMSRGAWYNKLQRVVNQYVTKVRDVGKPCSTCGTSNPDIKYDAGHYIAVGHNMDLRFELTNIHIQCSIKCNQFGRGMPVEYDEFIKNKYGIGHYNWLNTKFLCYKPHPTLKERFPTWQDIEEEINKFAKILRDHGITPNLRN